MQATEEQGFSTLNEVFHWRFSQLQKNLVVLTAGGFYFGAFCLGWFFFFITLNDLLHVVAF